MLTSQEIAYLHAICAMSHHPGSYHYLVEGHDGWCYLSHRQTGHVLYTFEPST